jgi:hypothetical protein
LATGNPRSFLMSPVVPLPTRALAGAEPSLLERPPKRLLSV